MRADILLSPHERAEFDELVADSVGDLVVLVNATDQEREQLVTGPGGRVDERYIQPAAARR